VPRDWDAATYDRIADPMFRWGAVVVGWLELEGSETVLDAGCGSGRVTQLGLGDHVEGMPEAGGGRLRARGCPEDAGPGDGLVRLNIRTRRA